MYLVVHLAGKVEMDFRFEHRDSPETILNDIQASRNAMELIVGARRGVELALPELRSSRRKILKLNSIQLSHARITHLIDSAREAREHSYAPYSHFNVGAAILATNRDGRKKIITGCNVENAAYGSTVCAERTAAFKAVSTGFRIFHAYAVVGGFDDSIPKNIRREVQKDYLTPCGDCRQVTNEFDADPCLVIMARDTGETLITTLEWILPCGFGPKSLGVDASAYGRHAVSA